MITPSQTPRFWLWALALVALVWLPLCSAQDLLTPTKSVLHRQSGALGAVEPLTIAVVGDSLADGIWGALYRSTQRDPRFEILRKTRNATGLARSDVYDWTVALDELLRESQADIDVIVVAIGLNDTQALSVGAGSMHRFRSTDWDQLYAERLDALMMRLRNSAIPTFWLGLPVMRSPEYSDKVSYLNDLFRAHAILNAIDFVPLWQLSVDEQGAYSSYLRDAGGRKQLMRATDGIHFTAQGYQMLSEHLWAVMANRLHGLGNALAQH